MKKILAFFFVFSFISLAVADNYREIDHIDIQYGSKVMRMDRKPSLPDYLNNKTCVEYSNTDISGLTIKLTSAVSYLFGKKVTEHLVEISSKQKLTEDLTIRFPVKSLENTGWLILPLKSGILFEGMVDDVQLGGYRSSGMQEKPVNDLALPLLIAVRAEGKNNAVLTDPFFSSYYEKGFLRWCYPKTVGLEDVTERRTIIEIEGVDNIEQGMELYYQTILKDVPAGPDWMKDIAMISYDYMSDGGRGWYNDIDVLTSLTAPEDRHKIALCMHGWYDIVGRYCFDPEKGELDEKWTNRIRGIELSLVDLHERIKYAKEKGYRVLMYFADGVLASRGLPDYVESEAIFGDAWNGPDILGGPYYRNILFPRQYDFFRGYAKALFTEFATEVDGFVWDETFYITADNNGTALKPGYMARTQMRLVKEIAAILHSVARDKAFFTSDLIAGEGHGSNNVPPYCMMADGTYQDSHSKPEFWSYGIFPNYRNIMWSCNWTAVSTFKHTVFAVENYNTPVVFTNGWGDDKGLAEMTPEEREVFMKLFDYRKQFRTKIRYFKALPLYYEAEPASQ